MLYVFYVSGLQVVILTDSLVSEQLMVNEWTRRHERKLIVASAYGLFGSIFTDLGPSFRVMDKTGDQANEVLLEHIDRVIFFCLNDLLKTFALYFMFELKV